MTSDTHTTAPSAAQAATPERSYDVPGIANELGTSDFPAAAMHAYWLGVHRSHALSMHRKLAAITEPAEIARYTDIRDRLTRSADECLALLKTALAAECDAQTRSCAVTKESRTVAEFDCATDARRGRNWTPPAPPPTPPTPTPPTPPPPRPPRRSIRRVPPRLRVRRRGARSVPGG